jgi:hypothetical protein
MLQKWTLALEWELPFLVMVLGAPAFSYNSAIFGFLPYLGHTTRKVYIGII